jgi:hypothetical protein
VSYVGPAASVQRELDKRGPLEWTLDCICALAFGKVFRTWDVRYEEGLT